MPILLLLSAALAGELLVEAQVPADVFVEGNHVAQLFYPSSLRVEFAPGPIVLTVVVEGLPAKVDLEIPEVGTAVLVVGRTGITTGQQPPEPVDAEPRDIEFRLGGPEHVLFSLAGERIQLGPGEVVTRRLEPGNHALSVRSSQGTIVWAQGQLVVDGTSPFVVQLSEGHLPEVVGRGGDFRSGAR